MTELSVVIPVFNVRAYLGRCVESVRQLHIEKEIILVDDGSTDGSGALCDALACVDECISVIHQTNAGLSSARNTGIANSRGRYIMFIDSDDFINLTEAEHFLTHLEAEPDILMGLYRNYYHGEEHFCPENCEAFLSMSGLMPVDDFLQKIPADGRTCYMVAWRFVVRRELFRGGEIDFWPGIYHEDEEWTARLFCTADNIYVSHRYFYQYRHNRDGAITSAVKPKHLQDCLNIIERDKHLCTVQKSGSAKENYLRERIGQLCLNVMLNLYVLPESERKEAARRVSDCIRSHVPLMKGAEMRIVHASCLLFGVEWTCALLHSAKKISEKSCKKLANH